MEIRFFDKSLVFLGISDGAVKVAAERNALGTGTFSAVIPTDDAAAALAVTGGHIITDDGAAYTIERTVRDDISGTLTLKAVEIAEVLFRSVIDRPRKYTGTPGEIIAGIVAQYSVSPISVIHSGTGAETVWCVSEGILYDEIKNIGDTFSLTCRMMIEDGALVLRVTGVNDRTAEAVLSDEFGTARIESEEKDISDYANVAVVFGEESAESLPYIEPFTVTAAECSFSDGIDDSDYGVRSTAVYKNTSKLLYIYESAEGFVMISRHEFLVRLAKTVLATHRPVIKYGISLTDSAPELEIGDRVLVRSDRLGEFRAATVISLRTSFDGRRTERSAVLKV